MASKTIITKTTYKSHHINALVKIQMYIHLYGRVYEYYVWYKNVFPGRTIKGFRTLTVVLTVRETLNTAHIVVEHTLEYFYSNSLYHSERKSLGFYREVKFILLKFTEQVHVVLRLHLHESKLAFKPSFKPTKVNAAIIIIYFGLKRILAILQTNL